MEITKNELNLLDFNGLYNYLLNHYVPVIPTLENVVKKYEEDGLISIQVFKVNPFRYLICLNPSKKRIQIHKSLFENWIIPPKRILMTNYNVSEINNEIDNIITITPKDKEGDNEFFLEVIDKLLDVVETPIIRKSEE